MEIKLDEKTKSLVGKITPAQAKSLLYSSTLVDEKLFKGKPTTLEVSIEQQFVYRLKFGYTDKIGFKVARIHEKHLKRICGTWLKNPILNKTGLACAIWSDNDPAVLRRRLDQKVERNTLLPTERHIIIKVIKELMNEVNNINSFLGD